MTRAGRRAALAVRDIVLVILIAWLGLTVITRDHGWRRAPDGPITVGDLAVVAFYLVWVLGSIGVMLLARQRDRSGWGWFFIAHTFSPLIVLPTLLFITRNTGDARTSAAPSPDARWRWMPSCPADRSSPS
jgi:hypothetical protein